VPSNFAKKDLTRGRSRGGEPSKTKQREKGGPNLAFDPLPGGKFVLGWLNKDLFITAGTKKGRGGGV